MKITIEHEGYRIVVTEDQIEKIDLSVPTAEPFLALAVNLKERALWEVAE